MKKDPLIRIFEACVPVFGKIKAADYVGTTVTNLLHDMEENGSLSSENLQHALEKEAEWTEQAAKKALKEKGAA